MLELKDICWNAPDGKQVLKGVNLKIADDCLVAVTGPNGGGKTTLAKIIMGIEKPSSGRVYFNSEDITDKDVTERANMGISFAFQQPVRFKGITVKQMIETSAGKELSMDELRDVLHQVGLCAKDYINRDIDATLSGGEIKRIEIASVLARHKKLSVFDEPEAGIDLWSFNNLISTFENMRRNLRGTLVIISHQERILRIADEIIIISDGKSAGQGPGPVMVQRILAKEKNNTLNCSKRELFNE